MLLTLFVDASHCQHTKVAGFGAWAKRKDWPTGRFFGNVVEGARNSSEAELRAIALSLEACLAVKALDGVDCIIVQSDSLRALQLLNLFVADAHVSNRAGTAPIPSTMLKPTDHERESLAQIRDMNHRLALRHVKGHKGGDGRQWVNNQCDQVARSWMRGAREREREREKLKANA